MSSVIAGGMLKVSPLGAHELSDSWGHAYMYHGFVMVKEFKSRDAYPVL